MNPTKSRSNYNFGMGELHLDVLVDRMRREFSVEANIGKPQAAYRETIKRTVEIEGKHVKQSGGRGQYGHVWLRLEPLDPMQIMNLLMSCRWSCAKEYIPAVKKASRANAKRLSGGISLLA